MRSVCSKSLQTLSIPSHLPLPRSNPASAAAARQREFIAACLKFNALNKSNSIAISKTVNETNCEFIPDGKLNICSNNLKKIYIGRIQKPNRKIEVSYCIIKCLGTDIRPIPVPAAALYQQYMFENLFFCEFSIVAVVVPLFTE